MKIIPTILSLNEQGKRLRNEDTIVYGNLYGNKGYFFAVCDGVGGVDNGDLASKLACQNIKKYLLRYISNTYNQDYMDKMIGFVENAFDNYIDQDPAAKRMATTMALLVLYSDKAIVAHIGDSRIYHIRGNSILFKTQDHSLVNDLIKSGIITEEKASTHPQRNIITRAIQGKQNKQVKADVHIIHNIDHSDYLFLCSDGILESITDSQLIQILSKDWSNEKKMEFIREQCANRSEDNYSTFLIQINKIL